MQPVEAYHRRYDPGGKRQQGSGCACGVELIISDAHEGIKAASKVLSCTWQRCRVHFMRNALAHAGKSGRRVVSAFIATAFAQDDAEAAKVQWRKIADQLRSKLPKLGVAHQDPFGDLKLEAGRG